MPSTIEKCKLFRTKRTTLSEGETFLRNKHAVVFFEIKCTFFGRKENTITFKVKFMFELIIFYIIFNVATSNINKISKYNKKKKPVVGTIFKKTFLI